MNAVLEIILVMLMQFVQIQLAHSIVLVNLDMLGMVLLAQVRLVLDDAICLADSFTFISYSAKVCICLKVKISASMTNNNILEEIIAMVTRKRVYFESCHLLALAGIPYKYNQCHTILEGLSSVCAKLEPASLKNNEILEVSVMQKFTSHALYLSLSTEVL